MRSADTIQPWSDLPQDPQAPAAAFVERLALLQRQILRANGLTTLERNVIPVEKA